MPGSLFGRVLAFVGPELALDEPDAVAQGDVHVGQVQAPAGVGTAFSTGAPPSGLTCRTSAPSASTHGCRRSRARRSRSSTPSAAARRRGWSRARSSSPARTARWERSPAAAPRRRRARPGRCTGPRRRGWSSGRRASPAAPGRRRSSRRRRSRTAVRRAAGGDVPEVAADVRALGHEDVAAEEQAGDQQLADLRLGVDLVARSAGAGRTCPGSGRCRTTGGRRCSSSGSRARRRGRRCRRSRAPGCCGAAAPQPMPCSVSWR